MLIDAVFNAGAVVNALVQGGQTRQGVGRGGNP